MDGETVIRHIVLVAGCQRSGTSLASEIAGAHPAALLLDEPDGFTEWFDGCLAGPDRPVALPPPALLRSAGRKYRPGTQRIVATGFGPALAPGVTHLVLNAPNYSHRFDEIARMRTPVSVLFPVRDARAVVASMTAFSQIPTTRRQRSLLWKQAELRTRHDDDFAMLGAEDTPEHLRRALVWQITSLCHRHFTEHGVATLVFRYEDLVRGTDDHARRIAAHMGLDFDPAMTAHQEVLKGFGPGMLQRERPVDSASVDKWAARLTRAEQEDIVALVGGTMRELGYNTAPPPAAPSGISDDAVRSPILLTGRGGSGTRLVSELVRRQGVHLGERPNISFDSLEWNDLVYEMAMKRCITDFTPDEAEMRGWRAALVQRARTVLATGGWTPGAKWGLKLPELMLCLPDMLDVFPNARIIHLVRHPLTSSFRRPHVTSRLDNLVGQTVCRAAYIAAGRDTSAILGDPVHMRNAITWLYQVPRVAAFARAALPADRYMELRFEDMCGDPAGTAARVAGFIGGEATAAGVSPAIDPERNPWVDPAGTEAREVWALCRDAAALFGYTEDPAGPNLSRTSA